MSIKELFKSNYWRGSLIILLYVIYAIAGTLTEYLFKYAINDITKGNLNGFIFWQIMITLANLLTVVLLPIATIAFTRQTQNYVHQIRNEIMHHYYNGANKKVSEMQNDLTGNLKMLSDNYANPWVQILSGFLQIILSITALLSLNWMLIIVTAVLAIITLLLPKIMEKKTSEAGDHVNKMNEKLLNVVEHWLGGLQELRRYSAYSRLQRKLNEASGNLVAANKKSYKYQGISYVFNGFGNAIAQVGMSFFAGILFFNHLISFGDFTIAGSFAFIIFSAIWQITMSITQVKSTKELRKQTFDLRKEIETSDKKQAYSLQVKDLVASYKKGETIAYPDFTVKPGQKVLLTGDSGTGKSTLFKVLLGKLKPASGQVTYYDKDSNEIDAENVKVGFVPQDPVVFPVSIKENILMFNQKLADKLNSVTSQVELAGDLEKMPSGLNTIVDLKNENLSGGQRQKVVLARSEIHNQPLVLMDEVTSAIDSQATEKIIDNLLKTNQTILMIAHNYSDELKAKFDQEIKLQPKQKED